MEPSQNVDLQRRDVEALLIIGSAVSCLSLSPSLYSKIPEFLSANMNVGRIAFVVARRISGTHEITHVSHSNVGQIDAARQSAQALLQLGELSASKEIVAPAQISFYRVIDPSNVLLLLVFPSDALGEQKLTTLNLMADLLAFLIGGMNSATATPAALGAPFDKLTDREWVVLQGLQSVEGEKQLADKLELSPHTLHSHIKSIYRKLSVQGRLPMLMMMENSQRSLKLKYASAAIAKILAN